jgi:hypothetical protein
MAKSNVTEWTFKSRNKWDTGSFFFYRMDYNKSSYRGTVYVGDKGGLTVSVINNKNDHCLMANNKSSIAVKKAVVATLA